MKLLIACPTSGVKFHVETPGREPLGGSESSAAYLARQLAANGHAVTLAAALPDDTPEQLCGVRHVRLGNQLNAEFFASEDFAAVIAVNAPATAPLLKTLAPKALHVAWLHLLPDQPDMASLHANAAAIDLAVFVSENQSARVGYRGKSEVIGNGIAPAFENLFPSAAALLAAKQNRAAYTSTPFRGLETLPLVARGMDMDFDIYSAMRIYQEAEDDYTALYARIRSTPRMHYHGALGQAALAQAMKPAAFLAYPCSFVETYCIAALEGIAAGLKVITTDLGALRETTLGFAELLPPAPPDVLAPVFAAVLRRNAEKLRADPQGWATERFAQAEAVNRQCSWRARAARWETLLAAKNA